MMFYAKRYLDKQYPTSTLFDATIKDVQTGKTMEVEANGDCCWSILALYVLVLRKTIYYTGKDKDPRGVEIIVEGISCDHEPFQVEFRFTPGYNRESNNSNLLNGFQIGSCYLITGGFHYFLNPGNDPELTDFGVTFLDPQYLFIDNDRLKRDLVRSHRDYIDSIDHSDLYIKHLDGKKEYLDKEKVFGKEGDLN